MVGIGIKMTEVKKKRLIKLTEQGEPTRIIAERLGMNSSQINYHQRKLGIWKGKRKET